MPKVLISPESVRNVEGDHTRELKAAGFEIIYPDSVDFPRGLLNAEQTIAQLRGCDAVIAGGEFLGANVIGQLEQLRVIARFGVGYDRVDVQAATARGIPLTITPNSNHESVAEHVFALIFAIAKSIVNAGQALRSGVWDGRPTRPVRRTNLGVFGLGRIGRSVVQRGVALGMRVRVTETNPDTDFLEKLRSHGSHVELVDFETLLKTSDYLTVHCPLNAQTAGMFNRDVFRQMKAGSAFINTARGGLVVETDLAEALSSGHLRAAGLDVFGFEPPQVDNPLLALDNVVITPHSASDGLAHEDMAKESASCIVRLFQGTWPEGCVVNDELRATWRAID